MDRGAGERAVRELELRECGMREKERYRTPLRRNCLITWRGDFDSWGAACQVGWM